MPGVAGTTLYSSKINPRTALPAQLQKGIRISASARIEQEKRG